MNPLLVILLPPAVALVGMRLVGLLAGREFQTTYGFGFRFAVGMGMGMLVFTQTLLLSALAGFSVASGLAWTAMIWGFAELALLIWQHARAVRTIRFRRGHLWLLFLTPALYYFWIFGRLGTLEGTMEFDGVAHWVIKSKFLFLKQGQDFISLMHTPNLAFVHWDYPWLVSALYTLNYGLLGEINEYINKVWPVWLVATLGIAIFSLANTWRRPRLLPIAAINILFFLPATLSYIHWEGGTIPMVFYASLTAMLIVSALTRNSLSTLAAAMLILAGCAATKFEGIIYFCLWTLVLLPVCWRKQWLTKASFWRSATVALICLLPYLIYRGCKPLPNLESGWVQIALHSPDQVLTTLPSVLGLGLQRRFFSWQFSDWEPDASNHLQWRGELTGAHVLVNYQLHLLPWVILLLLGYSFWQRRHSAALIRLTLVILGFFLCLAVVISSVPQMQSDGVGFLLAATGEGMGRYYYPFFMAWFLGIICVWFEDSPTPIASEPAGPPSPGTIDS